MWIRLSRFSRQYLLTLSWILFVHHFLLSCSLVLSHVLSGEMLCTHNLWPTILVPLLLDVFCTEEYAPWVWMKLGFELHFVAKKQLLPHKYECGSDWKSLLDYYLLLSVYLKSNIMLGVFDTDLDHLTCFSCIFSLVVYGVCLVVLSKDEFTLRWRELVAQLRSCSLKNWFRMQFDTSFALLSFQEIIT